MHIGLPTPSAGGEQDCIRICHILLHDRGRIAYRIANFRCVQTRRWQEDLPTIVAAEQSSRHRICQSPLQDAPQFHVQLRARTASRIANPYCEIAKGLQKDLAKFLFNMACNYICLCRPGMQKGLREFQITDGRATTRFFRLASVCRLELVFIQDSRLQSDCGLLPVYWDDVWELRELFRNGSCRKLIVKLDVSYD